jgi:5-methylcytosine-specific restriction endonuclease McrA
MQILRLNKAGDPLSWISTEEAVSLYCKEQIIWEIGEKIISLRGGHNKQGVQSIMFISPVIACTGKINPNGFNRTLTNHALFKRDENRCLYCGDHFPDSLLTRDHIIPSSKGGKDVWQNVVAACKRCNNHKGCMTLEEAGMELLALPFTPNAFEYMYLSGRKILGDQMDYLKQRFSHDRMWAA